MIDAFASQRPPTSGRDWINASNPAMKSLVQVAKIAVDLSDNHAREELDAARRNLVLQLCIMILALASAAIATLFISRRIARPMSKIAETMRLVADGDMACEVPFADRADEIGELSRALGVFRRNAIEKRRVEEELVQSRIAEQQPKPAAPQIRISGQYEPRASYAAQRHHRIFRHDAARVFFGPVAEPVFGEFMSGSSNKAGLHLLEVISPT